MSLLTLGDSHEISDEGIKSIRQGLRNLVSLKEVRLNFNRSDFQGFRDLKFLS